jgi:hypothetical protein
MFELNSRLLTCVLWLAGSIILAEAACARDDDELTSKVRKAWEKFTELTNVGLEYGERGNIAIEILNLEHYRANVKTTIRNLQILVDSFPRRRNNLQEDVYRELLGWRSELTATDHRLSELRLRLQDKNEEAFRQAERSGKRVKILNRMDLLTEFQRLDRESFEALVELKNALTSSAEEQRLAPGSLLKKLMNELWESGNQATPLLPRKEFYAQVQRQVGKAFLDNKPKRKKRGT